ncbi:MAG: STAS domain-containing protein [Actinobacteria bacterium]|jgi:SulP family sulfate permease|nr:STAS domain-containing protein [Actinomycetota bacterium]
MRLLAGLGSRRTLPQDVRAGLTLGVESVPDGLASGLLAGVNPAYGLYAYLVGTAAGALATSSVFMSVQATGAMSVIVADVPGLTTGSDATGLFTLSVITGAVMLVLGLLRLGSLVRFVPNAVLTGFINAVAVNIVLGQLSNLTGYSSAGGNRISRTIDTLLHPQSWAWASVAVGAATIGLILLLERTPVGQLGLVVAVVLTSAGAAALSLTAVATLDDVAQVPSSLPSFVVPDLSLVGSLLVPALSLALVGLVQGAGISGSIPNPDGRYPDASGDFRGQGVANIAAGLLQGMPVGGSMSATSLVRAAGARSRTANLVAAAVMALLILLFGPVLGYIAMPALAALLILVGVRSFRVENMVGVWRTGPAQATTMAVTFVLTLVVPLQYAVLVGVGLSVVLHVAQQSNRVTVTRWEWDDQGRLVEGEVPAVLRSGEVVVLQPYGSLFFAAVPLFDRQLPAPGAPSAAVILRLRGKQELGSTFITVLRRYSDELSRAGCRLYLAGVGDRVAAQLEATGTLELLGADAVFRATPVVTDSLLAARTAAEDWVRESAH